jgi:hypothetical protein
VQTAHCHLGLIGKAPAELAFVVERRAAWTKQAMPNFATGLTTRERALAGEITQVNIFQDFLTACV